MTEVNIKGVLYKRIKPHTLTFSNRITYPLSKDMFRVIKEGYLLKTPPLDETLEEIKLGSFQKWKKRYFILYQRRDNRSVVFMDYFKRHYQTQVPKGTIDLMKCSAILMNIRIGDCNALGIKTRSNDDKLRERDRTFYLTPVDQLQTSTLNSWLNELVKSLQMSKVQTLVDC